MKLLKQLSCALIGFPVFLAACGSYKNLQNEREATDFSVLSTRLKPNDRLRIALKDGKMVEMKFKGMAGDSIKGISMFSVNVRAGNKVIMLEDLQSISRWRFVPGLTIAVVIAIGLSWAMLKAAPVF